MERHQRRLDRARVLVELPEELLAKLLHLWRIEHRCQRLAPRVLVVEVVLERGERADVAAVPVHDEDEVAVGRDGEQELTNEPVVRLVRGPRRVREAGMFRGEPVRKDRVPGDVAPGSPGQGFHEITRHRLGDHRVGVRLGAPRRGTRGSQSGTAPPDGTLPNPAPV
jgi:hypothetical protein